MNLSTLLLRRRMMMQQVGGILPPGYTAYEWLVNEGRVQGNPSYNINAFYFANTNDFDEMMFTFKSNDTAKQDIFFWGQAAGDGYNSIIGYNNTTNMLGERAFKNAVITPNLTNTQKGSGQEYTVDILIGNVDIMRIAYGAYQLAQFSISRKIKDIQLLKNGVVVKRFVVCTNPLGYAGLWDGKKFFSSMDGGGFSCE